MESRNNHLGRWFREVAKSTSNPPTGCLTSPDHPRRQLQSKRRMTYYAHSEEFYSMVSTEERIRQLAREHLDIDHEIDFDATLGESDMSSVEAVAFAKLVSQEFGVEVSSRRFSECPTLRALADYLDSKA